MARQRPSRPLRPFESLIVIAVLCVGFFAGAATRALLPQEGDLDSVGALIRASVHGPVGASVLGGGGGATSVPTIAQYVVVMCWPPDGDQVEAAQIKFGKPIGTKVRRLLESATSISHGLVNINIVCDEIAKKNVQDIYEKTLTQEQQKSFTLTFYSIDMKWLEYKMQPLFDAGVSKDVFKARIWHWPKFFLSDVLTNVSRAVLIDMDVLVLRDMNEAWAEANTIFNSHKSMCVGGVSEHLQKKDNPELDADLYINTGIMLLNLARMRAVDFTNSTAIKALKAHQIHGQWPPEQWMFNRVLQYDKSLLLLVDPKWHCNCVLCVNYSMSIFYHYCGGLSEHFGAFGESWSPATGEPPQAEAVQRMKEKGLSAWG